MFTGIARASVLGVLSVLLAVAANTSASGDGLEIVTITAQNLPSPTSVSVDAIAARAVYRQFKNRHPNYEVRPFSMPAIEGQGMDSGPLMAIAAGIPPHVIYVNFRQSATYIAQGFLEPIEILLARSMSEDPRHRASDGEGNFQAASESHCPPASTSATASRRS